MKSKARLATAIVAGIWAAFLASTVSAEVLCIKKGKTVTASSFKVASIKCQGGYSQIMSLSLPGTITGTLTTVLRTCPGSNVRPSSYAQLYIPGTSYSAMTDASGKFKISGVEPGEYATITLGIATIIATKVKVVAGKTTDLGNIGERPDCCGDGFFNPAAGEQCEAGMPTGVSCQSLGYSYPGQAGCSSCKIDASWCDV